MRLLFLGAGAVGGYFGGRLQQAGADVTFLVRPARAELMAREGLRIRSPLGDATLQVKTVTRDQLKPEYDLVALAPKAYDLDDAIATIAPAIGPDTFLLPFLNGIRHMDLLDERFGRQRVLGGVAAIGSMLDPQGVVVHLNPLQALTAGGRDQVTRKVAADFIAICGKTSFDSVLSDNIEMSLWEKWTFLAALAGATTLIGGSVGDIMATPYGERVLRGFYAETCAVAAASGFPINDGVRAKMTDTLTKRGSPFTASMRRDASTGQRTEHDHVLGDLIVRADGFGQATPLLAAAHSRLQANAVKPAG